MRVKTQQIRPVILTSLVSFVEDVADTHKFLFAYLCLGFDTCVEESGLPSYKGMTTMLGRGKAPASESLCLIAAQIIKKALVIKTERPTPALRVCAYAILKFTLLTCNKALRHERPPEDHC